MREKTRRAWPLGLIGMMVLTAGVERFLSRHASGWAHTIVLDWRDTGRATGREVVGSDLLCFGSSMLKFGVLPRTIEAATGRRGYNLALLNGPPPASYFLLRRALDRGARPSAVVVDFDHNRLEDGPLSERFNYPWADLLRPGEVLDLARRAGDGDLFARLAVASALPSVRRRHEVRAAVLTKLQGSPESLGDLNTAFGPKTAFARNRWVNRGAVVNAPVAEDRRPPLPPAEAGGQPPWRCHPVNAHYLGRFLDLCRERRITVYWLLPPIAPVHRRDYYRPGALDRYLALVRKCAERWPQVTVVDAGGAGFPDAVYVDHVHLDRDGATALSGSLATLLRRPGSPAPGARWVALPGFRKGPPAEDVVDLKQTELALKAGAAARR